MARRETFQERRVRQQTDPLWLLDQAERQLDFARYCEQEGSGFQGMEVPARAEARQLIERAEELAMRRAD